MQPKPLTFILRKKNRFLFNQTHAKPFSEILHLFHFIALLLGLLPSSSRLLYPWQEVPTSRFLMVDCFVKTIIRHLVKFYVSIGFAISRVDLVFIELMSHLSRVKHLSRKLILISKITRQRVDFKMQIPQQKSFLVPNFKPTTFRPRSSFICCRYSFPWIGQFQGTIQSGLGQNVGKMYSGYNTWFHQITQESTKVRVKKTQKLKTQRERNYFFAGCHFTQVEQNVNHVQWH